MIKETLKYNAQKYAAKEKLPAKKADLVKAFLAGADCVKNDYESELKEERAKTICFRNDCVLMGDKIMILKETIRKLIRFTYGEGWNYSLGVKIEAEKILEN